MPNKCNEMKASSHDNVFWKYSAIGYTDQFDKRVLLRYDKNTLNITLILLKMINATKASPSP